LLSIGRRAVFGATDTELYSTASGDIMTDQLNLKRVRNILVLQKSGRVLME